MPTSTERQELIETATITFRPVLTEGVGGKKLVVRGEFARSGVPTANGRIYSRALWERELRRLQKAIRERKVTGELNHPRDGVADMFNTAHLLTALAITPEGIVIGEAEVLENLPGGKVVAELYARGAKVGVSSRGFGSTRPDASGNDVVQEDYELKTFDFVSDPADSFAYPEAVTESTTAGARSMPESRQTATQFLEGVAEVRAAVYEKIAEDPTGLPKEVYESLRKHFAGGVLAEGTGDVAALRAERDEAVKLARRYGFQLFVERRMAEVDEDEAKSLGEAVGDLDQYESPAALAEAVNSHLQKLASARQEASLAESHAQSRAEERRGYEARIAAYETALQNALALNEELAAGTYVREHGVPRAEVPRRPVQTQRTAPRDHIDDIVESVRRRSRPGSVEESRERVRQYVGRGHSRAPGGAVNEERATAPRGDEDYHGLGASLDDLKALAGI